MLLEGIVAASFLGLGCAIIGADSRLGRSAAYAILRYRRGRARRRAGRVSPPRGIGDLIAGGQARRCSGRT